MKNKKIYFSGLLAVICAAFFIFGIIKPILAATIQMDVSGDFSVSCDYNTAGRTSGQLYSWWFPSVGATDFTATYLSNGAGSFDLSLNTETGSAFCELVNAEFTTGTITASYAADTKIITLDVGGITCTDTFTDNSVATYGYWETDTAYFDGGVSNITYTEYTPGGGETGGGSTTPILVLDEIMSPVIVVTLQTVDYVFRTFWPFLLVIAIIGALTALIIKVVTGFVKEK